MPSNRSRVTPTFSLFLSYLLFILPCSPFTTAAGANWFVTPVTLLQEHPNTPHRDGELLVRFRGGLSQRDKDSVLSTHGLREIKQLRGESGFEKLELSVGRDPKTAALELLLDPHVEFAEPNFLISKDDLTPNEHETFPNIPNVLA